ncbi:MFS transporter [Macrococcus equi]|uniref:MFS transporter n=1 Tax=Macrococcus equi TaxID=3395462 RepID=UPI0039BE9AAB
MSYKLNIKLYYLFNFVIYFYVWMPIWVIYFQNKGLSLSQIGILDSIGYILMVLSEIPTGIIADKYGRKYSLFLGSLLYSLAMFGILSNIFSVWFLLGYILWNISNTFFTGAGISILRESLINLDRLNEFPKILGRSNSVMIFSQVFASSICSFIAMKNLELCFMISGFVAILGIIIPLFMKETLDKKKNSNLTYKFIVINTLKIIKSNKNLIWLLLFSSLMSSLIFIITYTIYQPYSLELGFSLAEISIILIIVKSISALGGLITGIANKLININYTLVILPLSLLLFSVLIGLSLTKYSILLLIMVLFIFSIFSPNIDHILNMNIEDNIRSTVLSFQGLLWTLLAMIIDPLILYLAEISTVSNSFMIVGGFTSAILIFINFKIKNHEG